MAHYGFVLLKFMSVTINFNSDNEMENLSKNHKCCNQYNHEFQQSAKMT